MRATVHRRPRFSKPSQPITQRAPGGVAMTAGVFVLLVVAMAVYL